MSSNLRANKGYTLIEVIIVVIIIGILATVAMKSLGTATETVRTEETKREMKLLAHAISGDPSLISGGIRTDFGYLGDIGSLPPNWDALISNPGGYATWNGPYIQDEFSSGGTNSEFKLDGWGVVYSTPSTSSFSSSGGAITITRQIANSTAELLYNKVRLSVTDLDLTPPGPVYADSVKFILTFPNGSGSMTTRSISPGGGGYGEIDSIPIGIHTLQIAFLAQNDTLMRRININPGRDYYADIQYYENIW